MSEKVELTALERLAALVSMTAMLLVFFCLGEHDNDNLFRSYTGSTTDCCELGYNSFRPAEV